MPFPQQRAWKKKKGGKKRKGKGRRKQEKKNENEDENQKEQGKNGWREGEWCKHEMRSNPWQLGYPKNKIEFEPQIPFLS